MGTISLLVAISEDVGHHVLAPSLDLLGHKTADSLFVQAASLLAGVPSPESWGMGPFPKHDTARLFQSTLAGSDRFGIHCSRAHATPMMLDRVL
jgi:hypothetical protein